MKRIGILTFWGVPNYGAWAQAYALNQIVSEMTAEDAVVEHIAYLHPKHHDLYYAKDEKLRCSFWYSWDKIKHTPPLIEEQLEQEVFDMVITGSDAIWEFSIEGFGSDEHLVGNRLQAKRLSSYAASFGTMGRDEKYPDWVEKGLRKYQSLAVRDQNSYEIVKELIGREATLVLDPALIWDFSKDCNVEKTAYKDYILVYGANWDADFIENSVRFAREKGLKLISVGYINTWCDINLRMIELRGLEWVGMFADASYVITSTFHGLMFGLNYGKQIKFNQVSYVKKRSVTLLENLGIQEYFESAALNYECFKENYDNTMVQERLRVLKEASIAYLRDALSNR